MTCPEYRTCKKAAVTAQTPCSVTSLRQWMCSLWRAFLQELSKQKNFQGCLTDTIGEQNHVVGGALLNETHAKHQQFVEKTLTHWDYIDSCLLLLNVFIFHVTFPFS